jgi:outer membrane protein assembly factor BamB
MRRATLLGAGLSLVAVTAVAPAAGRAGTSCTSDWPMFQHDPARSATTNCTDLTPVGAATFQPRWFLQTDGAVTAEAAIAWGHAFIGDGTGRMHAVDMATGKDSWTYDTATNAHHADRHNVSYGRITSSASAVAVRSVGRTVFFGAGGTVYAVGAGDGRLRWAVDVDPAHPTSTAEVESSTVVWNRGPDRTPVVYVGMDTNEDPHSADGGVLALDARNGALLWKYDAEQDQVVHDLARRPHPDNACGDIWSSPALDTRRQMLFFGGGNCGLQSGKDTQRVWAIRATTGRRIWTFREPSANHGQDDDFGASVVLTTVAGRDVAVQAGKSGWIYVLDRANGRLVRSSQAAVGASVGGFIGSVAVATDPASGHPVLYGDSAIPASSDDTAGTATNPERLTSLHAVDLVTGAVVWNEPAQSPSYAPVTVAGGIVFASDTTEFSVKAYDASNGAPVWHVPVAAATSGGVAVSGQSIVFGAGTYFDQSSRTPPQATGIWCFEALG